MTKLSVFILLLVITASSSMASPKVGVYRGVDYSDYSYCYMDVKKVDYNRMRRSRLNAIVYANLEGFDFRLQYRKSYNMESGHLEFNPEILFDIIQLQYVIYSGELKMNPATNHTTPLAFRYINRKREVKYCENLEFQYSTPF